MGSTQFHLKMRKKLFYDQYFILIYIYIYIYVADNKYIVILFKNFK
jgi:hypothetical protein